MANSDITPIKTGENGQRDDKGRFAEGNPGKPPGARHRITKHIKNVLAEVVHEHFTPDKIGRYIDSLDDTDKLRFFVNLLPYIAPKAPPPLPEPKEIEESPFDPSKLSDDELRYLAKLQEKAKRDIQITRTIVEPPIRWASDDPDPKNKKI
jgi:hypothetical protein